MNTPEWLGHWLTDNGPVSKTTHVVSCCSADVAETTRSLTVRDNFFHWTPLHYAVGFHLHHGSLKPGWGGVHFISALVLNF